MRQSCSTCRQSLSTQVVTDEAQSSCQHVKQRLHGCPFRSAVQSLQGSIAVDGPPAGCPGNRNLREPPVSHILLNFMISAGISSLRTLMDPWVHETNRHMHPTPETTGGFLKPPTCNTIQTGKRNSKQLYTSIKSHGVGRGAVLSCEFSAGAFVMRAHQGHHHGVRRQPEDKERHHIHTHSDSDLGNDLKNSGAN